MGMLRRSLIVGLVSSIAGSALAAPAKINPAKRVDVARVWGAKAWMFDESAAGDTNAVKGSVQWNTGSDKAGDLTVHGFARFPERTLRVDIVLAVNTDASLPASHLIEIRFETGKRFAGGSVKALRGVLLKNDVTVPGLALTGASVQVVPNQFIFALSDNKDDMEHNMRRLAVHAMLDLAVVFATGQRAMLTLELGGAHDAFKQVPAASN